MEKKKKKIELNAFVIIFCIMIFCALLTWIIPAGQFETAFDEVTGRDLVVPGTYQQIESTPVHIGRSGNVQLVHLLLT